MNIEHQHVKQLKHVINKMLVPSVIAAGLTFGSVATQPAMAQDANNLENLIVTQGRGEVTVSPDSLQMTLAVESQAEDMMKARQENNNKMRKIQDAIKKMGINNLTLKTQNFSVYPVKSQYKKGELQKTIGYRVNNSLLVKVTRSDADSLSKEASKILDTGLNMGATQSGSISFFIDDKQTAQGLALKAAVEDALNNAEILAKATGVSVSGVYSIEGYPSFNYRPYAAPMMARGMAMDAMAESTSTPIEAGETEVSSQVTIRFKFE